MTGLEIAGLVSAGIGAGKSIYDYFQGQPEYMDPTSEEFRRVTAHCELRLPVRKPELRLPARSARRSARLRGRVA